MNEIADLKQQLADTQAELLACQAALAAKSLGTEDGQDVQSKAQDQAVFRLLADNAKDLITLSNERGDVLYVSPSAERISGYSIPELLELGSIWPIIHSDDKDLVLNHGANVKQGKIPVEAPLILRIIRKDKAICWVETVTSYITDPDNPTKKVILGTSHDITDYVKNQRALEDSKAELEAQAKALEAARQETEQAREDLERSVRLFRLLADTTQDMVALRGLKDDHYYYVSPSAERLTGYAIEDIEAAGTFDAFLMPEDAPKVNGLKQQLMSGKVQRTEPTLLRYQHKNGTLRWGRGTLALVPSLSEEGGYDVLAAMHDVTELMEVQEALEKSQAEVERSSRMFRILADNTTDMVALRPAKGGKYYYISPAAAKMTGYTLEEMYEAGEFSALMVEEDLPKLQNLGRALMENPGQPQDPILLRYRSKDGEVRWGKGTMALVPSVNDPVGYDVFASLHDVTDLVRAQEELEKSQAELERSSKLFETLAKHSTDIVNLRTMDGKYFYHSPSVERLLGYTVEEMLEMGDVSQHVHPDDLPKIAARRQGYAEGDDQFADPLIVRFIRKDGGIIWVKITTSFVPDLDDPEKTNILASAHDMTHMIEAQEALKKSQEELERSSRIYRILADNTNDFIALFGHTGTYSYISPSSEKLLGYKPDELMGRTSLWQLAHPDDQPQLQAYRQVLGAGKRPNLAPMLVRITKKSGEERWYEISFSYVPSEDKDAPDDVIVAIHDVNEIIENQQAAEESRRALARQTKIMTQDVELAKTMQEAILPSDFPAHPNYEMDAFMKAARMVGGDFYDYFRLDEYRVGLVMADVSGKGVPAAFFMSMARAVMETEARSGEEPHLVLREVNRHLRSHNPIDLFVTMFYCIVDLRTGQLVYSNGGHNSPYIVRGDGSVEELEPTKDVSVGAMENTTYIEKEAKLNPGDTLFLFTDGITEAFDADYQMFDEDRLVTSLSKAHTRPVAEMLQSVLSDVQDFVGDHEQSDDLTCLAFRFTSLMKPKERRRSFRTIAEPLEPDAQMTIELVSNQERVNAMQDQFETFCQDWDIPTDTITKMNVCLEEYVVNLITHGFKDEDDHVIRISLTRAKDGVYIAIDDDGPPFNPLLGADPDLDAPASQREDGGLGIHIIRTYMDELSYETRDGVNRFGLIKYLD